MSTLDRELSIDIRETSTINKPRLSKKSVKPLVHFGDILRIEIQYGCNASLNGIWYGLFVIDRESQYTIIYVLKSLKIIYHQH